MSIATYSICPNSRALRDGGGRIEQVSGPKHGQQKTAHSMVMNEIELRWSCVGPTVADESRNRQFSPALLAYLSTPETLHDRIANGSLLPDDQGQRVKRTERTLQRLVGRLELADGSIGTKADKGAGASGS
ncbi:hypothetical protein PMIN06_011877 [Paraphaeosphaeria minitans]